MTARFVMGIIQYLVAFSVGFFLGVDFGSSPLGLAAVMAAFTLCMTAVTFLLATFVKTEEQSAGLINFIALTSAALGGAWWPLEIVPPAMRNIAYLTPVGWAMQGFNEIIFYRGGLSDVLLPVAVLIGATLVIFGIAVSRFKYEV